MMTDKQPLGDPPPPGEGDNDLAITETGDPPPPGGEFESVPGDPPPPGEEDGDPPPPGPITK